MPLNKFATILLLGTLSACVTPRTPPTADSACVVFGPIRYSVPKLQADGTRNMPTDDGNKHDTPATVGRVAEHNAKFHEVCEKDH